jgi:hypothetical protein
MNFIGNLEVQHFELNGIDNNGKEKVHCALQAESGRPKNLTRLAPN